jgi:hypothetical protein
MKKLGSILLTLLILFSCHHLVIAQNGDLTIGAQIRPRAEFRNGFKTLTNDGVDAAFFIEQRTRLFTDFNTDKYRLHISMQDVRIWGQVNQIYKTDNALQNVYEAYAEYRFTPEFSAKMGRMALNYDNARFFGNLGWAAQARSHDAFLLKLEKEDLKMHAGFAFNQNGFEPTKIRGTFFDGNNYKSMQYLWVNKNFGPLKISALIQNDGRQVKQDSTTAFRQTFALIPTYSINNLTIGAEAYLQTGKNASDVDVNASLLSLYLTYKTKAAPITLGMDLVSGSDADNRTNHEDGSFAPLYGTNHKFYGLMDYFYVGNGHKNTGLKDFYLKTKFKTGEKSSIGIHLHHFLAGVDIADTFDSVSDLGNSLGTEIDLSYNLILMKEVKLSLGYSHIFATETMEFLKGGDKSSTNNWFYIQFDFTPILFKKKREEKK